MRHRTQRYNFILRIKGVIAEMSLMLNKDHYKGREQAYHKHWIYKTYMERLVMIIGRTKADVINFVDTCAGPWTDEAGDLSDTSIGIALSTLEQCVMTLRKQFNPNAKMRILFVEKDPTAFARLNKFIQNYRHPNIEAYCTAGDFTEQSKPIIDWLKGHFTFFFIDPKGYANVIDANTLRPFLLLENTEFLINFMYDFLNRFVEVESQETNMKAMLGTIPDVTGLSPDERNQLLLDLYKSQLRTVYRGRAGHVDVLKPGMNKVLYHLVYLTRNAIGLNTFKETAEKMLEVQRITQVEVKLQNQQEKTGTGDLFAGQISLPQKALDGNQLHAKEILLNKLNQMPIKFCWETWANLLETTNLFPRDFQLAMRVLYRDNHIICQDGDVSRRRTKFIKPDYENKAETWSLKDKNTK